jgi:hypothetical protein
MDLRTLHRPRIARIAKATFLTNFLLSMPDPALVLLSRQITGISNLSLLKLISAKFFAF